MKPFHRKLLWLFLLATASMARAGMFGAEMSAATVEGVEKTPAGWRVTVTGAIDVVTPNGVIRLPAEGARLQVPTGNQLYALRLNTVGAYEQRLRAAVGKTVHIQMWGPIITIEAGRVVAVTAGDISLLRPTPEEAAFDLARLTEILNR